MPEPGVTQLAPAPPPLAALFEPRAVDYLPHAIPADDLPTPVSSAPIVPESAYYERTLVPPEEPAPPQPAAGGPDSQGEFLRLLEVVTSMCDHVIEYIEADRAERQLMMQTLAQLGQVITEGSTAAVAAFTALSNANAIAARQLEEPSEPVELGRERAVGVHPCHDACPGGDRDARERIVGGSMDAGPEPFIDLVAAESSPSAAEQAMLPSAKIHIAVEVRGRFGDRWVDGFEICEVMTTPAGPRYRLRRRARRGGAARVVRREQHPPRRDASHRRSGGARRGSRRDCERRRAGESRAVHGIASEWHRRRLGAGQRVGILVAFLSTRNEPVVDTGSNPSATARCHTWNGA